MRLYIPEFTEIFFLGNEKNPTMIVAQASLIAFQEYCGKTPHSLRENGQELLPKECKFEKCSLKIEKDSRGSREMTIIFISPVL